MPPEEDEGGVDSDKDLASDGDMDALAALAERLREERDEVAALAGYGDASGETSTNHRRSAATICSSIVAVRNFLARLRASPHLRLMWELSLMCFLPNLSNRHGRYKPHISLCELQPSLSDVELRRVR